MKILFKIPFAISLIIILIFTSTCQKIYLKKITYEGYVYDSLGGNPHASITVKLTACSSNTGKNYCDTYEVGTSVTDVNGHFYIYAVSASSGRYHVQAGSTHFDPYIFSVKEADLKTNAYTTLYLNHR